MEKSLFGQAMVCDMGRCVPLRKSVILPCVADKPCIWWLFAVTKNGGKITPAFLEENNGG